MAGKTYNAGTPTTALPVGMLVTLTTGSTANGITYAYPLYSGYTCTQLVARAANATITLRRTELGTGTNVILPVGNAIGDTLDFSFDGNDIVGWDVAGSIDHVYAMCYPCSDCGPQSGSTRNFVTGMWTNTIGGTAFKNVKYPTTGANNLPYFP
tara:strand:+ start:230 stop:691 length:462 start_codon:yes stop_codon:yes gene_type:complete